MRTEASTTVDELVELLARLDGVFDAPPPDGDPVDLLQHGLQCAHELTVTAPDDVELQLAGLVHDLGHAVDHDPDHARTGAAFVRPLLGDRIADLVGLHVAAKRYLASTEHYELSEASRLSLRRQGAAMTVTETAEFAAHPLVDAAITLRRADEAAKVIGRDVPGLDAWVPLLRRQGQGATE